MRKICRIAFEGVLGSLPCCALRGAGAAALALLLVLPALGQEPGAAAGPQIIGVRLGFEDQYKVGEWVPVWVTIAGGAEEVEGRLELTALDGDGVEATYVNQAAPPARIPARGEATLLRYLKFGRVRSNLTVRLRADRAVLAERVFAPGEFPQPLPASRELVLALGGDAGLAEAARQMRRRPEEKVVTARVEDLALLPDEWRGYDGVDAVVLVTGRRDFLQQLAGPQREALVQWVRLGGRILLSVGVHGEEVFGEQGVLKELAPGRFLGVVPQRRTGGLENFIGASERLGAGDAPVAELPMAVLADARGRIEVAVPAGPAEYPLVVHYPVGFGRATLLAVDLDAGPIAAWREREKLVRRLLEGASDRAGRGGQETARGRVSHIGYEDLSGQLRAALDAFPGVTLVGFSWVAALVVLYAALIGPVDYFLLRRLGGRMERTWFTFPAMAALFCLIAWAGVQYLRPSRLLVNQVEIVDVDAESGLVRGTAWAHLYSPKMATFDLALTPRLAATGAAPADALLIWQGLPGSGLGGMNSIAGKMYNAPYRLVTHREEGALRVEPREIPVQIRSTRSLVGRWWTATATGTSRLTASPNGALQGEIVNPLSIPLRDGLLAYNHWTYRLPAELAPGGRVRLANRLPDGNLDWRLTQRRVGEDFKEFSTPWDEAGRDVPRIVEMLMWHEAAGGRSYTGLVHRYQGEIDLSEHLRTGCAVLVARASEPASELILNGQAPGEGVQRWTWYRVVYPVTVEE